MSSKRSHSPPDIERLIGEYEAAYRARARAYCQHIRNQDFKSQSDATLKNELSEIEHILDKLLAMEKKLAARVQDPATPKFDLERTRQDLLERLHKKLESNGD